MVPAKRPRDEARIDGDDDEDSAPQPPVAAAADGMGDVTTTPSKSVRLNLTQESAEKEESKALGAILVAEASGSMAGNHVVTPALVRLQPTATAITDQPAESPGARRDLFPSPSAKAAGCAVSSSSTSTGNKKTHHVLPATITPSRQGDGSTLLASFPIAKRKLIFGRLVTETAVQESVRKVYGIIRKFTGGIGGNGSHGPIYGELTMGSMQKMVNLMKQHTGLCEASRFIDVGSGIGKPNFHVAQDPGVEFSYGIEIEADRWLLGMSCLKQVLNVAAVQQQEHHDQQQTTAVGETASSENLLQHRVLFEHGDIRNARTFDPFTHVYMFSIG
jgi:Histone methylation protein DOT1